MTFIFIILAVIVILAIWAVSAYNGFVKLDNGCQEAFSTMDVYLKKRYDLIPNLVETVKAYTKHEAETLEKVVAARTAVGNASTPAEKIESENALSGTLKSLFAVAEGYPELKANANYQELMHQLERTENDIAQSRKYYNAMVKSFNTKVQSFPSNLIASIFNYSKKPLYETEEAIRDSIKVEF
jgi:LemA protein